MSWAVKMDAGRRMLAVVRCGDQSLHETWAVSERRFDYAVSYFGNDADKEFPGACYVDRRTGGKWDGLAGFFQANPEALDNYDYFWFPDDDIAATAADLERLVAIAHKHSLDLCQPALDNQSYFSHLITLQHQSFELRFVNFVEIMVPLLSRQLLEKSLPMIEETRTGFGLDFVWPQMAELLGGSGTCRSAIVDSVTVRHTRPVGGTLHAFVKLVPGARTSKEELFDTIEDVSGSRSSSIHGVSVPRIRVTGGLRSSGRRIAKLEIAGSLLVDLLVYYRNIKQPVAPVAVLRHAAKSLI